MKTIEDVVVKKHAISSELIESDLGRPMTRIEKAIFLAGFAYGMKCYDTTTKEVA